MPTIEDAIEAVRKSVDFAEALAGVASNERNTHQHAALAHALQLLEEQKRMHDAMDALGDLYAKTEDDWILEVSHILTEPTCPTVTVYPENGKRTGRYRYDCGTIAQGIIAACEAVKKEVIDGIRVEPASPLYIEKPGDGPPPPEGRT